MKRSQLSPFWSTVVQRLPFQPRWYPAILVAGFLVGLLLSVLLFYNIRHDDNYPEQYEYRKLRAANGVVLYTLETTPDNVQLRTIETNVTGTPYYGINGGFFWEGALLSIAVVNDQPLKGLPGDYGSGWYNTGVQADLKRGTLVWDEIARRFSVQVVLEAGELQVTDKQHYWAQGGVSMGLSNERTWDQSMIPEQMPAYEEAHMRTGLVYDAQQNIYMIVTPTPCTIEQFRSAIIEKLGERHLVDGIFLDGDGSSQLNSKQAHLAGDHRQVYQMLTLKE